MRLGARLALTMGAVAIVPLVASGLWAITVSRNTALEASKSALEREADAEADFVARWTRDQVQGLAGFTRFYPSSLPTLGPALQSGLLHAVYNAVPEAVVVALVDADGAPVVEPEWQESPADRPGASDARARALLSRLPLSEALASGVAVGRPYRWPDAALPSLPVAVRASESPTEWVLGAEVSLDVAKDLLDRSTGDHALVLLDGGGDAVVGGDNPLVRTQVIQPLLRNYAKFDYAMEGGTVVSGASAPVDGTDWTIAVMEPLSEVERTAREIQRRLGLVIAGSGLLAVAAAFVFARSLSVPIASLRDSALAVAEGRFGLLTGMTRDDEVGELGRAFDHMSHRLSANAAEIAEQREEIEGFNRELQDRVDRRTRELREAQARLVRSGQLAAVAEMGAGLAHELNNPLASILGLTQVLRSRPRDERDDRWLADLEREATRCREVVAAMLRVAEADDTSSKPERVDAREIVVEAIRLVAGAFRHRGIALSWNLPSVELPALIDPMTTPRLLAQVLNALRAGLPEGARLDITAQLEPDAVVILLRPDRPVAVGEARDDWMAAGLGLWVARKLLDQVGGRLEEQGRTESDRTEEADRTAIEASSSAGAPWRVVLPGAHG
jgi:signal transduction histidine kinase